MNFLNSCRKLKVLLVIILNLNIFDGYFSYRTPLQMSITSKHVIALSTTGVEAFDDIDINKKLWTNLHGIAEEKPIIGASEVKLITYNCLGPLHGEGTKHNYATVDVTKWTRRRDKLLQELRGISADILCLQEISAKALRETFIPNLKHQGMDCFGFAPSKTAEKVKGKYGHKHVGEKNVSDVFICC